MLYYCTSHGEFVWRLLAIGGCVCYEGLEDGILR